MRQRLPRATGRQALHALARAGFYLVRIRGSHHFMEHTSDPTRNTSVPIHGNRIIPLPVIRNIIRTSGMSVEEFNRYL